MQNVKNKTVFIFNSGFFYLTIADIIVHLRSLLVVYFDQRLGAAHAKCCFYGSKTLDQRLGANFKKPIFAEFCCKFLAFLAFCHKKR